MLPNDIQRQPIIAGSYERVSTTSQARYGYSLAAQDQSSPESATANGWQLPDGLRWRDGELDNASGADWDLPGLNAMLDTARNGEFSVLIVSDLDRFARTIVKGLVLEEQLRGYSARVVYQRVPLEDTPEGRLLKNQLYSFAEHEREKFRLRGMIGRRQKAEGGEVVGHGPGLYGYRYTHTEKGRRQVRTGLEPDPMTAPIAWHIFERLLTQTTGEVANELNDEGIPSPRGARWHDASIGLMVKNTAYAGVWQYGSHRKHGTPDDPAGIAVEIPAIVDRDLWYRVQAALEHRRSVRKGREPQGEDPYLLRGVLACGHCHERLFVDTNNGVRYYHCEC